MTYHDLASTFRDGPREIPTAPKYGIPKWFCVYEKNGVLYVASGREHTNACSICPDRKLKEEEFPVMLDLYKRREAGEPVAKEAKEQSMNQSYWFGIIRAVS